MPRRLPLGKDVEKAHQRAARRADEPGKGPLQGGAGMRIHI